MPRVDPLEFVRNFPENGMKRLLQNPADARDLLSIATAQAANSARTIVEELDFSRCKVAQNTFIKVDYRHIESDVVLLIPWKDSAQGPAKRAANRTAKQRNRSTPRPEVTVYVLLEHQSAPDPRMLFRVLEYTVQIYSHQYRQRADSSRPAESFRLQPVLPVVFYTGSEHKAHLESIVAAVATDQHRKEIRTMGQTAAEALIEQGRKEGLKKGLEKGREEGRASLRKALLRLLRKRFGEPSSTLVAAIEDTTDVQVLEEWFDRAMEASSIAEVGIEAQA